MLSQLLGFLLCQAIDAACGSSERRASARMGRGDGAGNSEAVSAAGGASAGLKPMLRAGAREDSDLIIALGSLRFLRCSALRASGP
jgi:hypothetical protein